MNRFLKPAAAAVLTGALAFGLTACHGSDDDDRCRDAAPVVMFFSTVDRHYHYGSPSGKTVPGYKVPASARKVPGYKVPPGTATAPKPPKVNMNKPKPAPKPAPRFRSR